MNCIYGTELYAWTKLEMYGTFYSLCRGYGQKRCQWFFDNINEIYEMYGFFTKLRHAFNMYETGWKLNNKVRKVIAKKGAKNVHSLTLFKRGDNASVVACINAEGFVLHLSFKCVRENVVFKKFSSGNKTLYEPKIFLNFFRAFQQVAKGTLLSRKDTRVSAA